MDLRDLVRAVVRHDSLAARQWVLNATRIHLDWSSPPRPQGLDVTEMTVAASLAELFAERTGVPAPSWTAAVPASAVPVWLVPEHRFPRLRRRLPLESPEPLRKRLVFAPEDFLTMA